MAETQLSEIKIDLSSFSSSSKDDMLRQEMNEGEENENNQLHPNEEWMYQISLGLDSEDDLKPMANEGEENENNQPQMWKIIPKVPGKLLRKKTKRDYCPLAVSIGPYHRLGRKNKLAQMEKLKDEMMRQFAEDSGLKTEEVLSKVKDVAQQASQYYCKTETEDLNKDVFTEMMIKDGCFILQFIHCLKSRTLEMTPKQIDHVKRDMLLLENQLPISVLKSLMSLRYKTKDEREQIFNYFVSLHIRQPPQQIPKWLKIIFTAVQCFLTPILVLLIVAVAVALVVPVCIIVCCFGRGALKNLLQDTDQSPPPGVDLDHSPPSEEKKEATPPPSKERKEAIGDDGQRPHLLGLLYSEFLDIQAGKGTKLPQGSRGHYLYYSAKKLKKAGIQFRPSKTGALTDVKFKSRVFDGKLKLPPITIDASTKSMLLNLVAYETCANRQPWVTSYICFMDSLIDDAEDVEELRSKGILFNHLGPDKRVADLFNDMTHSMEPDAAAYNGIKREINKQCQKIVMRWVSEWKGTYFRSPWTVITVLAASLGLTLTAAQTYYAIT